MPIPQWGDKDPSQRMSAREWNEIQDEVRRLAKIDAHPPIEVISDGCGIHFRLADQTSTASSFVARLSTSDPLSFDTMLPSPITTTLSVACAIGDAAITVNTPTNAFPTDYPYYITINPGAVNEEIVQVIDFTSNIFTINRHIVVGSQHHNINSAVTLLNASYAWIEQIETSPGVYTDNPAGKHSEADTTDSSNTPAFCSNPLGFPLGNPALGGTNDSILVTMNQGINSDYFFDWEPDCGCYITGHVGFQNPQFMGSGEKIFTNSIGLGGSCTPANTRGNISFGSSFPGYGLFQHVLINGTGSPPAMIYLNYAGGVSGPTAFTPASNAAPYGAGGSALGFKTNASLLSPGYVGAGVAFVCGSPPGVIGPTPTVTSVVADPDGGNYPGNTYYYAVTVVTALGESVIGGGSFGNFIGGGGSNWTVTITWSASVSGWVNINGYNIYRYSAITPFPGGGELCGSVSGSTTTFKDKYFNLSAGSPATDTSSGPNTLTGNAQAGMYYVSPEGMTFAGGILVSVKGTALSSSITSVSPGQGITSSVSGSTATVGMTQPAFIGAQLAAMAAI